MRKIIPSSICILFLFIPNIHAQLLKQHVLSPGIHQIKSQSLSDKSYWVLKTMNEKGQIVVIENYKKKALLSKKTYAYNEMGDMLFDASVFDINNPEQSDTTFYEYEYDNAQTIRRQIQSSPNSTIKYELLEKLGDTLLLYQQTAISTYSGEKVVSNKQYFFYYDDQKRLKKWEEFDPKDQSSTQVKYTYFPNGNLKRRLILRDPMPKTKLDALYIGGAGGDDETYVYKYDKEGRIKMMSKIVKGEKYKIRKYQYFMP